MSCAEILQRSSTEFFFSVSTRSLATVSLQVLRFHVCILRRATARAIGATQSPQRVRPGSACDVQTSHRATTRATEKSAEGLRSMSDISTAPQRELSDLPKIRTAPKPERSDPPKDRRRFTFNVQNSRRATARTIRPTQRPQKVLSMLQNQSESDPTRAKRAEGSPLMFKIRHSRDPRKARRDFAFILKIRTGPRRQRSDLPQVHKGFSFDVQNSRRAAASDPRHAKCIEGLPSCSAGSLSMFNIRVAPRRERSDPPKLRKGFTLDVTVATRRSESNPTCSKCSEGSLSILIIMHFLF